MLGAGTDSGDVSDRSWVAAILLCFFAGGLGVHWFYAGKIGTGILQLLTFGGLFIWWLIDFIMICMKSFKDINGKYIKNG
ncbi:MAG: TM2 domain-containing protein [Spirochaetota bacterium]|nr:TM2 domain-containing protein [Spirochaetota bacterium]